MAYSVPTFRKKSKVAYPRVKWRCYEVLWAKMDWNFCFNVPNSNVVTYAYFGRDRVQAKTLGNGAAATNVFDVKRRPASIMWLSPSNAILAGFQYAYDSVDNVLYERWVHDVGLYDHLRHEHSRKDS